MLWRTGVEHAFTLSTKRFGLLLFIGGSVLAVVSVCQALRASFGPISKWRDWAFPAACFLAAAGIHWSADNAADKNLNGYVSSLEAREYLAAAPARQAEFLADRFGATGWRFERRPETMPNVMSEPLVPARALGNYGVHSDASGYFYIGWRILNNDRLKYFAPPVGLPILVAVVAKLTGLSAETVADVQTLMYLIVGLLLAIAVKNWSRSTVMAGVTLLCWAWLEEAARFAKYMMTESFGVFVVALFLAICSFATRETRNEPRQQDLPVLIALAFVLMFAIYVRDVFIVIGWLSLAVFLGLWRRPVRYRLKAGGFIAILFVASWLFVPLLHADRGLEAGPLSLTPISFIRVSSFEKNAKWAAGENAEPVGGPPLMQGLAFHAHSALEDPTEFVAYQIAQVGKFWGADNFTWIGQSGLPYLDHPLDQYGRHVYRLVVFVAVAGGLLSVLVLAFVRRSCELKQLAWVMALLFAFLIVATAFHTLMFVWFGPRARVSFYPFVMISAGLTPVLMARLVQALVWVKVPAGVDSGRSSRDLNKIAAKPAATEEFIMRVIVAGGDGYLGWPTAMQLAAAGHEVTVVDNYYRRVLATRTNSAPLLDNPKLDHRVEIFAAETGYQIHAVVGDLNDMRLVEELFAERQPEAVIHYAEQPSAPYSMMGYVEARETLTNNLGVTFNLIWGVIQHAPDCHIIKLGTMGEYGTPNIEIEEGWIEIAHKGRKDKFLFPRQAGSLYHTTKVLDTDLLWFYVRTYGIRVTDLMQGPVYGIATPQADVNERLMPNFHYDDIFGTVLNRFLVQAAVNIPLTVYGKGGQQRGYLNLVDTLQCVDLAMRTPPAASELRDPQPVHRDVHGQRTR